MSENTPTQLPRAFVPIMQCPVCSYSLKDIADDSPCPECGNTIDYELLSSPLFMKSVSSIRTWSVFGIIGWGISVIVIWMYQMLSLALQNTYGAVPPADFEYVAVWFRCTGVLAPIAYLIAAFRGAKSKVYRESVSRPNKRGIFQVRVVLVALPGVIGGVAGCLLLTCVFTMAM